MRAGAPTLSPDSCGGCATTVWTGERELAFRMYISKAYKLTIPIPEDVFSIVTDVSGLGIGGVMQVCRGGHWEAAAFFSR